MNLKIEEVCFALAGPIRNALRKTVFQEVFREIFFMICLIFLDDFWLILRFWAPFLRFFIDFYDAFVLFAFWTSF